MLVTHLAQRVKQFVASRIVTPLRPKKMSPLVAQVKSIVSTHKAMVPAVLRERPSQTAKNDVRARPNVPPNAAQFLTELNATLARRNRAVSLMAAPGQVGVDGPGRRAAPLPATQIAGETRTQSRPRIVPLRPAPPPPVAASVRRLIQDTKLWPAVDLDKFSQEIDRLNDCKKRFPGDRLTLQSNPESSRKHPISTTR